MAGACQPIFVPRIPRRRVVPAYISSFCFHFAPLQFCVGDQEHDAGIHFWLWLRLPNDWVHRHSQRSEWPCARNAGVDLVECRWLGRRNCTIRTDLGYGSHRSQSSILSAKDRSLARLGSPVWLCDSCDAISAVENGLRYREEFLAETERRSGYLSCVRRRARKIQIPIRTRCLLGTSAPVLRGRAYERVPAFASCGRPDRHISDIRSCRGALD